MRNLQFVSHKKCPKLLELKLQIFQFHKIQVKYKVINRIEDKFLSNLIIESN